MMYARQTVSLPATDAVNRQIEVVREHFAHAVTAHKVLTRATQLGLELLAADPAKLTETKP